MIVNIVCTGKPGDGLLRYSYEHCCYLNSVGIESQVVIIPNPKFTKEDYIKAIKHGSTFVRIGSAIFGERKI